MTDMKRPTRRDVLSSLSLLPFAPSLLSNTRKLPGFQLTTFEADVTPPLGHPLMGGGIAPAKEVIDRLSIRGIVLVGDELPIVIATIDWCEIRNDAYDAWRSALAEAAGTEPVRVLLTCIHQHDTPIADLTAERLLERNKCEGRICDLEFHERTVKATAKVVKEASKRLQPITHVGVGSAKVEQVASNRRYLDKAGMPKHDRTSATRDPGIRSAPEGLIDPILRTLSFWNESKPVAVINNYATHPMSYYGRGGISADFIGIARHRRQQQDPSVFQLYASGCSGNVTAGKFNDGATENRDVLAGRMEKAMADAWKSTKLHPLTGLNFRVAPLPLKLRAGAGYSFEDLEKRLKAGPRPFDQCLAAMGLSRAIYQRTHDTIDLPCVDFGPAQYLVLPGESYIEYQLAAASIRPENLVMVAGYGECSTGYVPTDRAFAENDSNLHDWCWVAPGSEKQMIDAIRRVLSR